MIIAKNRSGINLITLALTLMVCCIPVAVMAGDLEPSAAPGSTMHTLDEIYEVCAGNCPPVGEAPVARTGQTETFETGDDGDHQAGAVWPSSRFTDNANGTVKDNLTGLIWLKNASCFSETNWTTALTNCNSLNSGECGLSDGSVEGDWRLPNLFELESLRDMSKNLPALPGGHPFTGVQIGYWSSTTRSLITSLAWIVYIDHGNVTNADKGNNFYVWPVRGSY